MHASQTWFRKCELLELYFFIKTQFQQMFVAVVGPLFTIAAFLVQFLALPYPAFALYFFLRKIGMVFQASYKTTDENIPFDST